MDFPAECFAGFPDVREPLAVLHTCPLTVLTHEHLKQTKAGVNLWCINEHCSIAAV